MAVYQHLTVTPIAQDVQENSSCVRILWQSTQTGGSYNETERTAYYLVSVNGQTPVKQEVSYTLPMGTTKTIVDTQCTVPHDSLGNATVEVQTWMNTHISAGVVELRQTLELPSIPRATAPVATDSAIEGVCTVTLPKNNNSYTHSLFYTFGKLSGYIGADGSCTEQEARFSAEQVQFPVPESFYSAIPDSKQGQCTFLCRTYNADELIGERTCTCIFTAEEQRCAPVLNGTVRDTNDTTLALTGDENTLIRFHSNALCSCTAAGRNGAAVTKQQVNGHALSQGQYVLSAVEGSSFRFSAVDSRGYEAQQTVECTMIPYSRLTNNATVSRLGAASSRARLTVRGECFCGSFGQTENTLSVFYSIAGGPLQQAQPVMENGRYYLELMLSDLDYESSFLIEVTVADCLERAVKTLTLGKGVPVFDWSEGDFAFHVPVMMDSPLNIRAGGTGASTPKEALENLGISLSMLAGVEYETPERCDEKTVYTKRIHFGAMPNCAVGEQPHNVAATKILRCCGSDSAGRTIPFGGAHTPRVDVFADTQKIYLDTQSDCSGQTATVQLWYLKD